MSSVTDRLEALHFYEDMPPRRAPRQAGPPEGSRDEPTSDSREDEDEARKRQRFENRSAGQKQRRERDREKKKASEQSAGKAQLRDLRPATSQAHPGEHAGPSTPPNEVFGHGDIKYEIANLSPVTRQTAFEGFRASDLKVEQIKRLSSPTGRSYFTVKVKETHNVRIYDPIQGNRTTPVECTCRDFDGQRLCRDIYHLYDGMNNVLDPDHQTLFRLAPSTVKDAFNTAFPRIRGRSEEFKRKLNSLAHDRAESRSTTTTSSVGAEEEDDLIIDVILTIASGNAQFNDDLSNSLRSVLRTGLDDTNNPGLSHAVVAFITSAQQDPHFRSYILGLFRSRSVIEAYTNALRQRCAHIFADFQSSLEGSSTADRIGAVASAAEQLRQVHTRIYRLCNTLRNLSSDSSADIAKFLVQTLGMLCAQKEDVCDHKEHPGPARNSDCNLLLKATNDREFMLTSLELLDVTSWTIHETALNGFYLAVDLAKASPSFVARFKNLLDLADEAILLRPLAGPSRDDETGEPSRQRRRLSGDHGPGSQRV